MRDTKFRGFTIDTKQWVYGGFMQTPEAVFIIDYSVVVQKAIDGYPTVYDVVEVSPASVGQFTGLHDKNGKEIYGGDIIDFPTSGIGGPPYIIETINVFEMGSPATYPGIEYGEVIGNATENPSLLKGDGE